MPSKTPKAHSQNSPEAQADSSAKPDQLPVGEHCVKPKIKASTIVKFALLGLVVAIVIGYLAWDIIADGPLMQLLSNRDELVRVMDNLGPWAPLFYILIQIIQVVVAPIPGQIVGGVGGFLFGHWGILWTTIGSIVGFWLVFCIARKFGRPLIEKIFKKPAVDKFDFIINAKGAALIIFAIFLLPGFPDDLVCYVAGLTKLSMRKLLLVAILGRFPTIVFTNYIGMGINGNIGSVVVLSLVGVAIVGLAAWKREKIMAFLKRGEDTEKTSHKSAKS